jgi:hypothetical protein
VRGFNAKTFSRITPSPSLSPEGERSMKGEHAHLGPAYPTKKAVRRDRLLVSG